MARSCLPPDLLGEKNGESWEVVEGVSCVPVTPDSVTSCAVKVNFVFLGQGKSCLLLSSQRREVLQWGRRGAGKSGYFHTVWELLWDKAGTFWGDKDKAGILHSCAGSFGGIFSASCCVLVKLGFDSHLRYPFCYSVL